MTQRLEPDLTSTWVYDTAANGIGKLASATSAGATAGPGLQKSFTYDSLGRPTQAAFLVNNTTSYNFSATYDANSRLSGGTIVGAGKPSFPGGMQIPPTSVQIIRGP